MKKKYRVTWRTPSHSGELEVATADFSKIPILIFAFFECPPGCPFLITRVELIDPDQYLQPEGEF